MTEKLHFGFDFGEDTLEADIYGADKKHRGTIRIFGHFEVTGYVDKVSLNFGKFSSIYEALDAANGWWENNH